MYDSISSNLARLIRRRWYFLVVGALIGGLATWTLALQNETVTAIRTIDIREIATVAGQLQISGVTNTDVRLVATRADEIFDTDPLGELVDRVTTPDTVSSQIRIDATGADRPVAEQAVEFYTGVVADVAIGPRMAEVDVTIAAQRAAVEALQSQVDEITVQLDELPPTDPARDLTIASLVDAQDALRLARTQLVNQESFRAFLLDDFVMPSDISYERSAPDITAPFVGVVIGAVVALVVMLLVVVFDNRVRRRVHLERAAPGCPVLAVVPKADPQTANHRATMVKSMEVFAERSGVDRLLLVALSDTSAESEILSAADDAEVGITIELASGDLERASATDGAVAIVLLAEWGRTTEQQVAAAAATLGSVGLPGVGTMLVRVPAREMDFAGVSALSGAWGSEAVSVR